jgi:hypothetical protein
MSGTSSEKQRLDSTREELRGGWPPEAALRMAARKFGPEEHDRDDGDCMAQIQALRPTHPAAAGGRRVFPSVGRRRRWWVLLRHSHRERPDVAHLCRDRAPVRCRVAHLRI